VVVVVVVYSLVRQEWIVVVGGASWDMGFSICALLEHSGTGHEPMVKIGMTENVMNDITNANSSHPIVDLSSCHSCKCSVLYTKSLEMIQTNWSMSRIVFDETFQILYPVYCNWF